MKMALKSDRNGDLQLDEKELEEVIQRLQNMSPRKLDEYKLRKALCKSPSVGGLCSLASEQLEDMSEYEAFTFPRSPSLEK